VSISTVQRKLEDQSTTIEKMQGQTNMMMQGIVERDKQYFERSTPVSKPWTRQGKSESLTPLWQRRNAYSSINKYLKKDIRQERVNRNGDRKTAEIRRIEPVQKLLPEVPGAD
jgi:hypothetical protein